MYKFLLSVSISFLIVSNSTAQTGTWQNINIFGGGLTTGFSQMVFVTDSIGYIYGPTQNSPDDMEKTTDTAVNFTALTIKSPLKGPTYVTTMAWPTALNGYIIADTGNVQSQTNAVFCLHTSDGGVTWVSSGISDANLQIQNLYFPTASVGYGTGSLADGSGDFVAKTIDGGATWTKAYSTTKYSFSYGKLFFKDPNNGMIFAQSNSNNKINIAYTTNGGTSFNFAPTGTDSIPPNFLQWNNDNSWLVGIDSVYRSVDSGKNWKSVVAYDTGAGPATVAAFHDSVGFIFRANKGIVYQTNDYGVTWASSHLPDVSTSDTISPIAASMPSSRVAYLLGTDANNGVDVMMKIKLTPPVAPPQGVAEAPNDEINFRVYSDKSSLIFDAPPADESRTIKLVDLLGRECASINLPPSATSSRLALSTLRAGSYFARLGADIVKFNIWQ